MAEKKTAEKKVKKAAVKKTATKKVTEKKVTKVAAKKTTVKKATEKKVTKAAAKKTTVKKATEKKVTKAAAKKTTSKAATKKKKAADKPETKAAAKKAADKRRASKKKEVVVVEEKKEVPRKKRPTADKVVTDEVREILPPKLAEEFADIIESEKLTLAQAKDATQRLLLTYAQMQVHPFEAIGSITAQSIGEPGTQLTMRTYHYAGVLEMNVTLGLPRIIEIVDARKEPSTPVMTVFMAEATRDNRDEAIVLAGRIKSTAVQDLCTGISLDLLNLTIVAELDVKKLKTIKLEPQEVLKAVKKGVRGVTTTLEDEDSKIIVKPKKKEYTIKDLQTVRVRLADAHVIGIPNITHTTIRKRENEYIIYTEGSNLAEILNMEGVDVRRTTTNNVQEIANVLGIEAARNAIIREITNTMAEAGVSNVDIRHIMLVADTMTSDGVIKAIGRYGVSGEKGSVLARASFEVPMKHLMKAAIRGDVDRLSSVVENVAVGQPVFPGTGSIRLLAKPLSEVE